MSIFKKEFYGGVLNLIFYSLVTAVGGDGGERMDNVRDVMARLKIENDLLVEKLVSSPLSSSSGRD